MIYPVRGLRRQRLWLLGRGNQTKAVLESVSENDSLHSGRQTGKFMVAEPPLPPPSVDHLESAASVPTSESASNVKGIHSAFEDAHEASHLSNQSVSGGPRGLETLPYDTAELSELSKSHEDLPVLVTRSTEAASTKPSGLLEMPFLAPSLHLDEINSAQNNIS
ncbi:unnamed protein product [Protopolystoma xenopodis]|uniref:Uncharacterized protein n=1 Tax=Protopolystoma xenopodis TaxID=117903 RepID=A0A448WBY3_9PLAT|nr:unnamed protein product [Protopolystoma xenopodis]